MMAHHELTRTLEKIRQIRVSRGKNDGLVVLGDEGNDTPTYIPVCAWHSDSLRSQVLGPARPIRHLSPAWTG